MRPVAPSLAPPAALPADEKAHISELDYVIALDLETSGLNEQTDQILEIAAVFGSFKDGQFIKHSAIERVMPLQSNIETWHEKVLEMHSKNGLLPASVALRKQLLATKLGTSGFLEKLDLELAERAAVRPKDRLWTLLGNTVHFDLRFVRRVFPRFANHLSHRVLDVSSIRLFCELLGKPYEKGDVAHRAMADVEMSLRLLDECRGFAVDPLPYLAKKAV